MAEIIWTAEALNTLEEIAEYIAVSSETAASKLVVRVFEKTDRLEQFPKSGRLVEELREMAYREVIVNPCRVIYKIDNETVYILHVVRQERELRRFIIHETEAEYHSS